MRVTLPKFVQYLEENPDEMFGTGCDHCPIAQAFDAFNVNGLRYMTVAGGSIKVMRTPRWASNFIDAYDRYAFKRQRDNLNRGRLYKPQVSARVAHRILQQTLAPCR